MTTATMDRRRAYAGPAILSWGFRPFFLFGALWAAVAMAMWLAWIVGGAAPPGRFAPVDWHVHELLWGWLAAIFAGFLLTAIPNWTGRLPVMGAPLAGLAGLWLLGRAAVLLSEALPPALVAAGALAAPVALLAVAGREIVAGRAWRNLPVLGLVALHAAGGALFHWEAASGGLAVGGYGARLGIASAVGMVLLIGGRITPSFTRNWLARRAPGPLPAPMGRFDAAALLLAAVALTAWTAAPGAPASGWLTLAAGLAHCARLARWAGWRTLAEPMVTVLHAGYGFAALGMLLTAWAILGDAPPVAGLHAWTAGAAGVMTLAVMTRASLGHTGRALTAGAGVSVLYLAAILGALARILAAFQPAQLWLTHAAAALWIIAFGGFVALYWRVLTAPKPR